MAKKPLTPSLSPSDGERVAERPGEGIAFPTNFLRKKCQNQASRPVVRLVSKIVAAEVTRRSVAMIRAFLPPYVGGYNKNGF